MLYSAGNPIRQQRLWAACTAAITSLLHFHRPQPKAGRCCMTYAQTRLSSWARSILFTLFGWCISGGCAALLMLRAKKKIESFTLRESSWLTKATNIVVRNARMLWAPAPTFAAFKHKQEGAAKAGILVQQSMTVSELECVKTECGLF